MNELLSHLEERAGWALFIMDQERCEALVMLARGLGHAQAEPDRIKFLQELDSIREDFLRLYRDHVAAVSARASDRATDVVSDIHHLLWIRNRTIFWGAQTRPEDEVSFQFASPDYYAGTYPGPRPVDLPESCAVAVDRIWPISGDHEGESALADAVHTWRATGKLPAGRDPVDGKRLDRLEAIIEEISSMPSSDESGEDWAERLTAFVQSKNSLPVLIELLQNEEERVRRSAAIALGQLGS